MMHDQNIFQQSDSSDLVTPSLQTIYLIKENPESHFDLKRYRGIVLARRHFCFYFNDIEQSSEVVDRASDLICIIPFKGFIGA